ncbi:MAG: hypothetical protein DHS20C13_10020 [Thermodesulfobacteriota bacterium]|nr:MAG: hypothetical protein DHS20C13_10020 [Thermodesulfobacteriota bacterium]
MTKILILPFLILLLYGGCSSSNQEANTCYLLTSSNPCFDSNIDGSTSTVIDQTVEEVISDQQNMEGFQMSLDINNITKITIRPQGFDSDPSFCPYEQSALVIKTRKDWQRFRNSCIFSVLELPDVDFENHIVLVSNFAVAQFGTTIEAVLEFDNRLSVVINDSVSLIPPPGAGFPINIVSVPRVDLPVDFIRVKNDITPTIPCLDASSDSRILEDNIECPTDALVQICNTFLCSNLDLYFAPFVCLASSCFDFSCQVSELGDTFESMGTGDFNIETVVGNRITGMVTIDFFGAGMVDFEYSCSPLVN